VSAPALPIAVEVPAERHGLAAWLTTTDHKRIGTLYIGSAWLFFLVAASFAMVMRTQTMLPGLHVVSATTYDQLFSVHGTTMVFLFGMPILIGFANYLVPLQIGAEDMAFPRLNAFSYWTFLFGGLLFYSAFLFGPALDTGWFSYAPLTERVFSPHDGVSFWTVAIAMLGVSSLAGAVNFIVTMNRLRAPAMRWSQMPVFSIATYINSFLILFAIPSLTAAVGMLYLDRHYGTHFFTTIGGDPIIWQHLFWFFGHPEVYILILPAFGMMSEVVPVFSRKPLFGRTAMIVSLIAIGFLGFGVWAHHMFTTGLPTFFNSIMAGTSMLIAIPTGVKIFNWLATMWGGALRFKTSLLFACGLIALFTIGGITGVTQAVVPFDWQVNDTFYIVGHLHNVLFAGTVFAVFAGIYYWFPKMTGRMLSERIGKVHFWVTATGVSLTFFPMYIVGLMGMPRRISTYAPGLGWTPFNFVSAIGAYIIGLSVIVFLINVVHSLRSGRPAGDDPWDAWTLEWATTSPPPHYNFDALPVVISERPLWDVKHGKSTGVEGPAGEAAPAEPGEPGGVGAAHAGVERVAHGTPMPLWLALGVLVIGVGLLTSLVISAIGLALLAVVMLVWMGAPWRGPEPRDLPGQRFTALGWGMIVFLGSEVVLFGSLIAADVHLRIHNGFVTLTPSLDARLAGIATIFLLSSGVAAHYALVAWRKGARQRFHGLLVVTVVLGAVFLAAEIWEWTHAGFGFSAGLRGETLYTLTGLHALHVSTGIAILVYLLIRTSWRPPGPAPEDPAEAAAVEDATRRGNLGMAEAATYYWHFVDAVWVAIFFVVYLL
jgi:cytochrome c oxidase subunit I